jgi:hypothetical protein
MFMEADPLSVGGTYIVDDRQDARSGSASVLTSRCGVN